VTDLLTELENDSIRKFLNSVADEGYFKGRVLDYGCGTSPYRRIVEEHGGEYTGFDLESNPVNQGGDVNPELARYDFWAYGNLWDTILCTQVLQYVPNYEGFIRRLGYTLGAWRTDRVGVLVMTYPTNWPEVQEADLHRFTKAGMERLLIEAGFSILRHDRRAVVHGSADGEYLGYDFALGYGLVARA
jgi:predicted TPR repeat methyltransferase